ncbi:MAG: SDR family NAD(P)-dependent oxidoreductase [Pirellulales bacterium]|nr:SDR family NAD(P)-dependent oxidoreductase [Pirellulales bacterium]
MPGYPVGMGFWREKVVLVTGGSSGLGRVIAEAFAAAGAKLAVVGLEGPQVDQAAAAMQAAGHDALGLPADITRQEDVERSIDRVLERFGRLDVLVNNAGRSMRGGLLETTAEQFRDLMELNLIAAVRCTRAAVPHLLERRGHVVNIGSLASKAASRWVGAYPATKFAVAAYSQQLRLELGPQGLHVLLVCPGPIRRKSPRLYPLEGVEDVPKRARSPGAGVRLPPVAPERLAEAILRACQRRKLELVLPARARILFAISSIWPTLGDWIIGKMSG